MSGLSEIASVSTRLRGMNSRQGTWKAWTAFGQMKPSEGASGNSAGFSAYLS